MAFCDISDNREITLQIKKTESFYCRGINLHLLFNMPILKYLFLFYLFLAMLGLFCCVWAFCSWGKQGLLSSYGVQPSHCNGFSDFGAQALECLGFSSCGSWTIEHKLNSCGA